MANDELKKIANTLVDYCKTGQERKGLDELYAEDAVSVEAMPMPGTGSAETQGVKGIHGKHDWWENAHEVHSSKVEGPFFHGDNRFGCIFEIDVTDKESGNRMQMKEMGVYTVDNGRIVREEFYYAV